MAVGLASKLPDSMYAGLTKLGIHPDAAAAISHIPPVSTLFAAFLGDNPINALLTTVDPAQLQAGGGADIATLTGREFFPGLISDAFHQGLVVAFSASVVLLLIAIVASALRGKHFVHEEAGIGDVPHHHHSIREMAREGAALEVPNPPDGAYEHEEVVKSARG